MSNLRRIMQKLAGSENDMPTETRSSEEKLRYILGLHVHDYQKHLAACSVAMLQYEWAWLEEHIEDLKLCLIQPEMLATLGGEAHVKLLLVESEEWKKQLEAIMIAQNIQPALHSHAILSSDHAWDVCQESIKKAWGF
jgi:hypothetical protein